MDNIYEHSSVNPMKVDFLGSTSFEKGSHGQQTNRLHYDRDAKPGVNTKACLPKTIPYVSQDGKEGFRPSQRHVKYHNAMAKSIISSLPSGPWIKNSNQLRPRHYHRPEEKAIKLFFKPLQKKASREEVYSGLARLGTVTFFRVPFSTKKRKNLGYGFVTFESRELALSLIEKNVPVEIKEKIYCLTFDLFDHQKLNSNYFQISSSNPSQKSFQHQVSVGDLQDGGDSGQHHHKPTSNHYHRRRPKSKKKKQHSNFRFNLLRPEPTRMFEFTYTSRLPNLGSS